MRKKMRKMSRRKRSRARQLKKKIARKLHTLRWPAEAPLTHKR